MNAEVLTIGDELLRGEIIDSNKALISERLLDLDIETRFQSSVRDAPPDMRDAFQRAAERADCVLVSGGLGPTRDDLTAQVFAESFGLELNLIVGLWALKFFIFEVPNCCCFRGQFLHWIWLIILGTGALFGELK